MQDTNRIEKLFDFEDENKIENLREKYKKLTEKALSLANKDDCVDKETALINRDRVFNENLLKVIDIKEKELGRLLSPSEKNYIIKRIFKIVSQV